MNLEATIELASLLVAVITFIVSGIKDRAETREQTRRETVRSTLKDFAEVRHLNKLFTKDIERMNKQEYRVQIRNYLSDLERFAVGCNLGAYDVEILNRMSGGLMITQYRKFFRPYIYDARRSLSEKSMVRPEKLYIEYEDMMRNLYAIRNLSFESVDSFKKDDEE